MNNQLHRDITDVHAQNQGMIELMLKMQNAGGFDPQSKALLERIHYTIDHHHRSYAGANAKQLFKHMLQRHLKLHLVYQYLQA